MSFVTLYKVARPRHAFSLIEAAIVLGIIGLVVGGIWAATNAVRQRSSLNQLFTDIETTNSKLWNLYKGFDFPTSTYNLSSLFLNAGLVPSNWQYDPLGRFITPEGIYITPVIEVANQPKLYINGMSEAVCYNLFKKYPFAIPNPPIMALGDCSLITVYFRRNTN